MRERRRRLVAVLAAVGVAAAGSAWLLGRSDPVTADRAGPPPATGAVAAGDRLVISLQGAAVPLMAVVGGGVGGTASVLTIPPHLSMEIPGVGSGDTGDVAAQPGGSMRTSMSNTVGTWIDHYAVFDLDGVARAVDRAGGLVVTLPSPATVGTAQVGPGDVTLSGRQVRDYLGIDGPNAFTRWEVVLLGLTAQPFRFQRADVTETDDVEAANAALRSAEGAEIASFPTTFVTGRTRVPDYETLDALMSSDFGAGAPPVPALVINGAGGSGRSADVARLLVPKGFRVVLSENAEAFDQEETQVVATGDEHVADAERARRALGTGVVAVTPVPSGIADVTIVIGKDFRA